MQLPVGWNFPLPKLRQQLVEAHLGPIILTCSSAAPQLNLVGWVWAMSMKCCKKISRDKITKSFFCEFIEGLHAFSHHLLTFCKCSVFLFFNPLFLGDGFRPPLVLPSLLPFLFLPLFLLFQPSLFLPFPLFVFNFFLPSPFLLLPLLLLSLLSCISYSKRPGLLLPPDKV